MAVTRLNVSLAFAKLPQEQLDNFTSGVSNKLYSEPAYNGAPVTKADLDASNAALTAAIAAAKNGSPADTADKNTALQNHIGLLRQLAAFVQTKHNNDLALLLRSGFQARSTNRASVQLNRPQNVTVDNSGAGELVASVSPVPNCNMYEGRATAEGSTTPMPSVFTGDSQHIYFPGLTPGVLYKIEIRCLGGADPGYSDWSDPVMHRSM